MEEKVLIKSSSSKTTKKIFIGAIVILLVMAVCFFILQIVNSRNEWAEWYADIHCRYDRCCFCDAVFKYDMETHLLTMHGDQFDWGYVRFDWYYTYPFFFWLFIILAGIFGLIYFLLSRCNITVTDKNISGRTFWGKKVVLPIHMVSAYSTSKVFSVLAITTASGFIKFPCIGNREEIASVLQQLLNERQQKTETQEVLISKEDNSKNLNDLVKLKNLLDEGIITQEEFDAKKKEILGL